MGRNDNEIALQGSATSAAQPVDLKVKTPKTDLAPKQDSESSPASSEGLYDTQTEESITVAWEKTKQVAEQTMHVAEGLLEKTKGAAVAVKETLIGKTQAPNDDAARGKKDDDAANAVHEAAAAAAGERHDETLTEKVQHIAGAAWGKTKEMAEVAWEKTRETAIAVKDKVIQEETPLDDDRKHDLPDAPDMRPTMPSDAHPIAPMNQQELQIDRKQLKVPVAAPSDIPKAELPKGEDELHAAFEEDQRKAPLRRDGGIGAVPPVSELTFGGGAPQQEMI